MQFLIWIFIVLATLQTGSILLTVASAIGAVIYFVLSLYFNHKHHTSKHQSSNYIMSKSDSKCSNLNNEGVRLCCNNDFKNGIQMFEMAIAIKPDFSIAKYNIGIANMSYKSNLEDKRINQSIQKI